MFHLARGDEMKLLLPWTQRGLAIAGLLLVVLHREVGIWCGVDHDEYVAFMGVLLILQLGLRRFIGRQKKKKQCQDGTPST